MTNIAMSQPILVINNELNEAIEENKWLLSEKLVTYRVPKERWNDIWERLDSEDEIFGECDEDLDVQQLVGWFQGVAAALGTQESELVTL